MSRIAILALSLALGSPALADPYTPRPGDMILPSATGIVLRSADGTSGTEIAFGAAFHEVMLTIYRARPEQPQIWMQEECPLGPAITADFAGQLSLTFTGDRLSGWSILSGLATPEGITIGQSAADLRAAAEVSLFDSTLGLEFDAGGIYGLLSEDGQRVDYLWGGAVCIFR